MNMKRVIIRVKEIRGKCVGVARRCGPHKLGLAKKGNKAYVQCMDPGEPYTNGGTVIFEIITEPKGG